MAHGFGFCPGNEQAAKGIKRRTKAPGLGSQGQAPTVFPALSSPRIRMQYSSFWNTYLYSPDSSVYILPGRRESCQEAASPHLSPARLLRAAVKGSPGPPTPAPRKPRPLAP